MSCDEREIKQFSVALKELPRASMNRCPHPLGPQPHPSFIEVFGEAAVEYGDWAVAGASEHARDISASRGPLHVQLAPVVFCPSAKAKEGRL